MSSDKHWILKNLVKAVIFVVVVVVVCNVFLKIVTRHNRTVTVPDMAGMTLAQADSAAHANGVEFEVHDSVYIYGMTPGVVLSQLPKAGSEVKKGRNIAVTINSIVAKKVRMPNLVGSSVRQANVELRSLGLRVGNLRYRPDIATNMVLEQRYKGKKIKAGKKIVAGSKVDLVIGLNDEDGDTYLPDITGKTYQQAVVLLNDNYLNIGETRFPRSTKTYSDSVSAVVVSQFPPAGNNVRMGTPVNLKLRKAESED